MNPLYQPNINQLSLKDFDILGKIAQSNFSSVYKVKNKKNGQIYALKRYDKSKPREGLDIDNMREKSILYDITQKGYPNIVKLYADFEDNNTRNLVMEFVEGITLKKLRGNDNENGYVSQDLIINILTQLLEILVFLHDTCRVIHRDIKPDNIILQNNNQIKLLGFGISAYLKHSNNELVSKKSIKGEMRFVPPEMLFYGLHPDYDYKMDIFSLGFTMYSLMNPSNKGEINLPQITKRINGTFTRIEQNLENKIYNPKLIEFVKCLYENDKNKRPTAKMALEQLKYIMSNNSNNQNFNQMPNNALPINHNMNNNMNNNFNNINMNNNFNNNMNNNFNNNINNNFNNNMNNNFNNNMNNNFDNNNNNFGNVNFNNNNYNNNFNNNNNYNNNYNNNNYNNNNYNNNNFNNNNFGNNNFNNNNFNTINFNNNNNSNNFINTNNFNNNNINNNNLNNNNTFNLNNNININNSLMNFSSTSFQNNARGRIGLNPGTINGNGIISSMKSLLQIFYHLDIMNNIKNKILSLFSRNNINNNNRFITYSFIEMMNYIHQLNSGNINKDNYTQKVNEFITTILNNNNSGLQGTRPIVLWFIIASIINKEINQYFNNWQNNIFDNMIQNNFMDLNNFIPITNQKIYDSISQSIVAFKNKYKGPLVDNFYFFILSVSRCPNCNNLFGIRSQINQFLQLDVKNPQNNISDLINNYFSPKIGTGNYLCNNCGLRGKKLRTIHCLNLPNYLILEFEDKNTVDFTNDIKLSLFNGTICTYQYLSGIYKFKKNNNITDFVAVIKNGNNHIFYSDDKMEPCPQSYINLECPSLAIYKKMS